MGVAEQEKSILEDLKKLSEEEPADLKKTDELLEEIDEESEKEVKEVKEEEPKETEEEQDEEIIDEAYKEIDEEEDDPEEGEEPEEELPGAKFRHKLKAEKEAREKLERELQEVRLAQARQEGRAEANVPASKEEAEEIPDQEYEPEKYAIWKASKLEKEIESMKVEQARINAERQWETIQNEHSKSHPEYNDAKSFLYGVETDKIKALYPSATDAQIAQHLREQEYVTVGNAARAGIDPVQHIEFLAYQAGFRTGEKVKEKIEEPKKKANIKNIKRNAKKNASLIGGSSAGETGDGRSAEQLAAMGMQEINEFGRDKYEEAIKKIAARNG